MNTFQKNKKHCDNVLASMPPAIAMMFTASETPDSIEKLLEVLATHTLDRRTFGGSFISHKPGFNAEYLKSIGIANPVHFCGI